MPYDKCAACGCSYFMASSNTNVLSNSGNRHNSITKFYVLHRKFVVDEWCTRHNSFSFCSIEFQFTHTHPSLYFCDMLERASLPNFVC